MKGSHSFYTYTTSLNRGQTMDVDNVGEGKSFEMSPLLLDYTRGKLMLDSYPLSSFNEFILQR